MCQPLVRIHGNDNVTSARIRLGLDVTRFEIVQNGGLFVVMNISALLLMMMMIDSVDGVVMKAAGRDKARSVDRYRQGKGKVGEEA
jgi:hypothetical protein